MEFFGVPWWHLLALAFVVCLSSGTPVVRVVAVGYSVVFMASQALMLQLEAGNGQTFHIAAALCDAATVAACMWCCGWANNRPAQMVMGLAVIGFVFNIGISLEYSYPHIVNLFEHRKPVLLSLEFLQLFSIACYANPIFNRLVARELAKKEEETWTAFWALR